MEHNPRGSVNAEKSGDERHSIATGAHVIEHGNSTVARHGTMPNKWLIEPAAAPGDPTWQGRPIWQLVVRARSAAFARIAAEHWARRAWAPARRGAAPDSNAGFENPKLYRVSGLEPGVGPRADDFEPDPVIVLAGPMPSTADASTPDA